jgi:serine phosphatase RsbU (regulator of sigma subunit)
LFSDGVVEARPDGGEAYGLEALGRELERMRDVSPREATRLVTRTVLDHRSDQLQDDATILIIDIQPRG